MITKVTTTNAPEPAIPYNLTICSFDVSNQDRDQIKNSSVNIDSRINFTSHKVQYREDKRNKSNDE